VTRAGAVKKVIPLRCYGIRKGEQVGFVMKAVTGEGLGEERAGVRAICFDAFGTLVEITDKRRPFRTLLRDQPNSAQARSVLTEPLDLRAVATRLSGLFDEAQMARLEDDLHAEIASIRIRPGIAERWNALRGEGSRSAFAQT
jgi:hypothetical protein